MSLKTFLKMFPVSRFSIKPNIFSEIWTKLPDQDINLDMENPVMETPNYSFDTWQLQVLL